MKRFVISVVKHIARAFLYGAVGGFFVLLVVFVLYLENRPDLKIWHEVELDTEYTKNSPVSNFAAYIALEEKLFSQLELLVVDKVQPGDRSLINRYNRGSLSDPGRWSPNWNRTFELAADAPQAGVLLLHGMSDSPYSLRNAGQQLNAAGAWVVGLRLPGHGTVPSGLINVQWQDMAAAVRMAVRHLNDRTGGGPIYLVGYSTGGALAVQYALSAIEDQTLPQVDGLVLISPSIGVARIAAMAEWQSRLGNILGFHKLAWNAILPEYDPFKYGSFAVNAGTQVYRLTADIQVRLKRIGAAGALDAFPSVLAFQSAVDATVSTRALVQNLFEKLPATGHELVLFDINRYTEIEQILREDPQAGIKAMLNNDKLPFSLSLVTNQSEETLDVVVYQKPAESSDISETNIGLHWPRGLYSLSHIALPFPRHDPLYGGDISDISPGIQLGNIELRGERGVLQISASDMLRLRWNPFYPYLEQRLLEFVIPAIHSTIP